MTVHEQKLTPARAIPREAFAFLRGAVQGLPLAELWDRYLYLEGKADLRRARRKLQWLKDEFRAAARREGRSGLGRLVSLDLTHLPEAQVPSLEAFAERFPEGFYGEAELAKLWARRIRQAGARAIAPGAPDRAPDRGDPLARVGDRRRSAPRRWPGRLVRRKDCGAPGRGRARSHCRSGRSGQSERRALVGRHPRHRALRRARASSCGCRRMRGRAAGASTLKQASPEARSMSGAFRRACRGRPMSCRSSVSWCRASWTARRAPTAPRRLCV